MPLSQIKRHSSNILTEEDFVNNPPLKHIEEGVLDRPPIRIARLDGKPLTNAAEAETFALKNLRGKYLNKDTNWEIDVYRRGIEKALSGKGKSGDFHIQAISVLPEQLKNAVLVESRSPKEENTGIRKIHRFFAPVDINGVLFRAKLTVKETDEGKKFYDQSLTEIEKVDAELSPSANSEESANCDRSSTLKISITDLLKGAISEDGRLRVNVVPSAYGKDRISFANDWVKKGKLKYYNKEKSREWLRNVGLQLSESEAKITANPNILTEDDFVNNPPLKRAEGEASSTDFHNVKFASVGDLIENSDITRTGDRIKVNLEAQEFIRRVMEENDIRKGQKNGGDSSNYRRRFRTEQQPYHQRFALGVIPSWAKDDSFASKLINARAETLAEKASFKNAFRSHRCIIPASGFFEWSKKGTGAKQPFYFHLKDKDVFGFAGLWEEWLDKETGESVETCTIITTEANEVLEPVHDRMPVILESNDYGKWLDEKEKEKDTGKLQDLLMPFPSERMNSHLVSRAVNSPAEDSSELINQIKSK